MVIGSTSMSLDFVCKYVDAVEFSRAKDPLGLFASLCDVVLRSKSMTSWHKAFLKKKEKTLKNILCLYVNVFFWDHKIRIVFYLHNFSVWEVVSHQIWTVMHVL